VYAVKKLGWFLIVALIGILTLLGCAKFGQAQEYTYVNGVISVDTTWSEEGILYSFTGPVAVKEGVTLTIEQGVQVDLSSYFLQVDGTLKAKGSVSTPVSFIGGEIRFMPSSNDWDETTGTGSILENVNIPTCTSKITIDDSSPKITSSDLLVSDFLVKSGSPDISNNKIDIFSGGSGFIIESGSPLISYNDISGKIAIKEGSPIIFNNKWSNSATCIEATGGNPYISHNVIAASRIGISISNGVIERNSIHCHAIGIEAGNCIIRNNTIGAVTGIQIRASCNPTIAYNNFEYGNVAGKRNVALMEGASQDVDVSNNWWATTNEETISKSLFDDKNDFTLGTLNFKPYLTEENPQATPDPYAPIPKTDNILTYIILTAVVAVTAVLVVAVVVLRTKKPQKK